MNINSILQQKSILSDNSTQQYNTAETAQKSLEQDTVSLSETAMKLSISNGARPENIERMNKMLENARNDPDYASTLAKNLAYSDFLMSVDVSTISEGGDVSTARYTNGSPMTKTSTVTSVQKWENEAKQYKEENINLYNTEKEKGASDLNIIMMIMEKNINLPESFRKQQGNDYL